MRAGDRVAVAVSGGADSLALLRMLLELRSEIGIVLSVAHFHHGIRGADADADEEFVKGLASGSDLEFHSERGDARAFSSERRISLETAARELRRDFFRKLLDDKKADLIATAHTLDDQAETVLMKAARGAGTRGLAGIFPEQKLGPGKVVRPLLEVRRQELRSYLRDINQSWREDQTNADLSITRNRVRSLVLPILREKVNPSAEVALSHIGEIARAEEEYWNDQIKRLLPLMVSPGEPARGGGRKQTAATAIALDLHKLEQQQLAVQRRLLRAAAESLGCSLDFEHVQDILDLIAQRTQYGTQAKVVEIAHGWRARLLFRELRIESYRQEQVLGDYEHHMKLPGEVRIAELGTVIRARISEDNGEASDASYNRAHSIQLSEISGLIVRNWRAGDRFRPARHMSEKRVKELLYPLHLAEEEKRLWPVVIAGDRIVWVRGVDSPELRTASGQRLWIEEVTD